MINRVLLIGNPSPTSESLSRTLGGLGFGVDMAPDGRNGLSLATRRRYSHVVIDDDLQDEPAIPLFRQLTQIQQSIGVLLTTSANLNTVYSAIEAGMLQVLSKPVDYDQLLPLLEPSPTEDERRFSEREIAMLSLADIRESLSVTDLIEIIRSVDYPFAGKHRLEHFDRDTLERVVHLVARWCRQRAAREADVRVAG